MKVNINDRVKVRFTEHGFRLYGEHLFLNNQPVQVNHDHCYYIFTLWELMSIFGDAIYLGSDQIFVNNEIDIENKS